MSVLGGGLRGGLVLPILVLMASCGGTSTDVADTGDASPQSSQSETSIAPAVEEPETTSPAIVDGESPEGVVYGDCGTLATMIEMNAPIDAEVMGSKLVVCVEVPDGLTELTFVLSDMTAALNLFVGYPDLTRLEAGGDGFWASEQGGRDDELITIEPGVSGFVDPGPYFIEISGGDSADGSTFVLTVNAS